eukprot:scaffold7066_cov253-Pinguiococcus_pyrenoidosus.AAC.5
MEPSMLCATTLQEVWRACPPSVFSVCHSRLAHADAQPSYGRQVARRPSAAPLGRVKSARWPMQLRSPSSREASLPRRCRR